MLNYEEKKVLFVQLARIADALERIAIADEKSIKNSNEIKKLIKKMDEEVEG